MDKTYKRVWCLYRVSTDKQLYNEEDIPVQKSACENFVKQQGGWEITNELYERGVSGWKTKTEDRDALNEIKEGAVKGKFDILLVFMLDRLGRREDESPLVISFLHEHNVEVWSVKEGKTRMDDHTDKLINYIRFWQSSGESIKTSIRVREAMEHLNLKGGYAGGNPPFGYKIVDTDEVHPKKKKPIKALQIDENEALVVRKIFDLCVHHGYGSGRIAKYLNKHGYQNRQGKRFRNNSISRVLRNKIYIGIKVFNKFGSDGKIKPQSEWLEQPHNPDLQIIEDELFYNAQRKMDSRKITTNPVVAPTPSKENLFSGIAFCKQCGGKLKSDHSTKTYRRKSDGKVTRTKQYRYRCNNARDMHDHGKRTWGSKMYDNLVVSQVKAMIGEINLEYYIDAIKDRKVSDLKEKEVMIQQYKTEVAKLKNKRSNLNSEISNALVGESAFTPKQLSQALNKIEEDIDHKEQLMFELEKEIKLEYNDIADVHKMVAEFSNWEDKFDKAEFDQKKAMLSQVVDNVYLGDGEIYINFKLFVEEALKVQMSNEKASVKKAKIPVNLSVSKLSRS